VRWVGGDKVNFEGRQQTVFSKASNSQVVIGQ
jgi:hypothetical protein